MEPLVLSIQIHCRVREDTILLMIRLCSVEFYDGRITI